MIDQDFIINKLITFIPLVLSLSVHEFAHAWSAWRLGDDTARLQGRMTLNPLVHIDPIGTVLLPLMGVPFGWAKPVPVNPHRFRPNVSRSTGMMIVAAAGPISNVLLAALCVGLLIALYSQQPEPTQAVAMTITLLHMMVLLNVVLAAFNMLPVPPLDGSRIVEGLLPQRLRPSWYEFCQVGPFLLLALLLLPTMLNISLFGGLIRWTLEQLARLQHIFS